ncbi:MAG: hypothetical protein R3D56_05065 [Paracoccaceae bacterium]
MGLISELQGDGIVFCRCRGALPGDARGDRDTGRLRHRPLARGFGGGLYWSSEGQFDLQGVISPLYLVNGISQIFSRQRDGLFGFNYTLKGTRDSFTVRVRYLLDPGAGHVPQSLPQGAAEPAGDCSR